MNYNELYKLEIGEDILAKYQTKLRKAQVLDVDLEKNRVYVIMEIEGYKKIPKHDLEAWLSPSKIHQFNSNGSSKRTVKEKPQ